MTQRAVAQGDRIAPHSWSHPDLTAISFDQLVYQVQSSRDIVNNFLGDQPARCLRSPYGASNNTVLNVISANGLAEARWDIDPTDWQVPPSQVIADRVVGAAHPGAVVLMHDGGGYRGNTVAALPQIIDRLQAQGYTFRQHLLAAIQRLTPPRSRPESPPSDFGVAASTRVWSG